MNVLIIYKTKYGSTEEYAKYVNSQVPGSDLFSIDDFKIENLKKYNCVVLGSRTYMGNIEGKSFLIENWDVLKSKKVFLFAVGLIDPKSDESKASFERIPEEIRSNISYLKVPGRIVKGELNFFERLIANARNELLVDKVDMSAIKPLIENLKKLS
jgi:menaquinone-dependent protoporphyrinogen IX oxidase